MEYWIKIKKNMIDIKNSDEWDNFIKWYSQNIQKYVWEACPMGDHVKVWFSMSQANRDFKDWETNEYEDGMLAYKCWDEYSVNKNMYEKYLLSIVK